MTTDRIYLPAAVRSGMHRKIDEAMRNAVDGHAATRGTPMESELRYYHNFYMAGADIPFEDFVAAVCDEVSATIPGAVATLDWVRKCDRWAAIGAARRELAKLRASATHDRTFRISFWGMLWKLTEVYLSKFALSCAEIGTTLEELSRLARQYLMRECSGHVERLRILLCNPVTTDTRREFLSVDEMLKGIPLPPGNFLASDKNHLAPAGAYALYRRTVAGHSIDPIAVGWSHTEHRWCEALIFPNGRPPVEAEALADADPTAQAIEICAETAPVPTLPPACQPTTASNAALATGWLQGFDRQLRHLADFTFPALQFCASSA